MFFYRYIAFYLNSGNTESLLNHPKSTFTHLQVSLSGLLQMAEQGPREAETKAIMEHLLNVPTNEVSSISVT
jgi:hypothetical protein